MLYNRRHHNLDNNFDRWSVKGLEIIFVYPVEHERK